MICRFFFVRFIFLMGIGVRERVEVRKVVRGMSLDLV